MARCFLMVGLLGLAAGAAFAGVDGQPQPDAALKVKLATTAGWFLTPQKNVGRLRADFLQLLEQAPTADITDLIAPALGDPAAYQGAVATFTDALDTAKDQKTKLFLQYNIARTHFLRARLTPVSVGKNPYAEEAARALEPFDRNSRDAALWELKGDIENERGNVNEAIAAYRKIVTAGGTAALSEFKIAQVWQRARRYPEAQASFERALQSDTASDSGGGEMYHRIYQGLAALYIEQGNFASALDALQRSTKLKPGAAPFSFRLDVARTLLKRGYNREVAAYAQAALKQTPGQPEALALLQRAGGKP